MKVAQSDARWIYKTIIVKVGRSDHTWDQARNLIDAVREMNSRGYRLVKVNLGYGSNYQHGIDLVFRHETSKIYAFVESKGMRYGPKVEGGIAQGSKVWNKNRLDRARNEHYAKRLRTQLDDAEHLVFFQGKLQKFSTDKGGVLIPL